MENLNKENFFNPLMEQYPEAVKLFCQWIDAYKKEVSWDNLFLNSSVEIMKIKFHDIPIEMQYGILCRFFLENDIVIGLREGHFKEVKNEIDRAFTLLQAKNK